MLDEVACEKLFPTEEIGAFDVLARIGQHFFQSHNGQKVGLQDQPLEGFRQAHRNILRVLLLKLHHPIHFRTESGAVRDDKDALPVIALQPGKDAGICPCGFAANCRSVVQVPIELEARVGILHQKNIGFRFPLPIGGGIDKTLPSPVHLLKGMKPVARLDFIDFFHAVGQGVQVLPIEDHIIVVRIPGGGGEIIGSEIQRPFVDEHGAAVGMGKLIAPVYIRQRHAGAGG